MSEGEVGSDHLNFADRPIVVAEIHWLAVDALAFAVLVRLLMLFLFPKSLLEDLVSFESIHACQMFELL